VSAVVQSGGWMRAAHASATLEPYTCPCPVGTVVENPRSTTVCQNVTPGYHDMSGDRSGPRGSSSQAGDWYSSCGFHHTTGSEEFCRYITLGTSRGSLGDRSSAAS
jgi:hypothetical protein